MEDALGFVGRFIFYVVVDLFLYSTARIVLPLITFGRVRAAPLHETGFGWARKDGAGVWILEPLTSVSAGILIWCGIGIAVLAMI